VSLSIAPTALAATWFARAGARVCIRDNNRLLPTLRELPLSCLHWPHATCEALKGVGVSTVGDCLRLPRDGFARRYGVNRLLELDRAVGRLPDPRDAWRTPERFVADFEMTEEQSDRELLLAICEELLKTHERFLLKRQLGTQLLEFGFYHLKSAATEVLVGGAELNRSARHWFDLLRIRFEAVQLPEPVIAVRLRSGDARPLKTTSSEFSFSAETRDVPRYSMTQLAERLIARIGRRSVRGMAVRHDHRPQFAARDHDVLKRESISSVNTSWVQGLRRPLWLLKEPRLLQTAEGRPLYRGVLRLIEGPERFETGWWDKHAIARDYFIAVNPQGLRLWIFRERKVDGGWHLHGLFG
jgi:protein ImuB